MYVLTKIYNYFNDRFFILKKSINCFNMFINIAFPFGKKAYVIGTPEYTNIGDSAICLAEMNFLHRSGFSKRRIKEISTSEYLTYRELIKKYISSSSLICGMGGGNMGNHWYNEELLRYAPDIVLSANKEAFSIKTKAKDIVLLCMRSDKEKILSESYVSNIEIYLQKIGQNYKFIDMYSEYDINKKNRLEYTRKKLEEFAGSKLVITDRLHAMIFSAITETPCIVFDNVSKKISGTYEWIKYLDYIKYVDDMSNLTYLHKLIDNMINLEDCKFDNTPLLVHFNKIAEVIKNYAD